VALDGRIGDLVGHDAWANARRQERWSTGISAGNSGEGGRADARRLATP